MKKLTRCTQSFVLTVGLLLSLLGSNAAIAAVDESEALSDANRLVETQTKMVLHDEWNTLLNRHVKPINSGHSSAIDYAAIQQDRAILTRYLNQLSQITQAEFDAWDKASQLAFLINAYNAWTVELILTKYPDIDSIKELGGLFSSPWDKSFIPLLGKTRSLNDIEHTLIREEAYTGAKLELQLTEQTERFLADNSRNYAKGDSLYLSSIFKWYGDDFTKGFRNTHSIEAFLLLYSNSDKGVLTLTPAQRQAAEKQQLDIEFLDYDWSLNVAG